MGERHFIRQMDDAGIVTRGGRRIAWNEFTRIVQSRGKMQGAVLSDEYILHSSKGKVSLPTWRTENAEAAKAFMLQRLPSGLFDKGR